MADQARAHRFQRRLDPFVERWPQYPVAAQHGVDHFIPGRLFQGVAKLWVVLKRSDQPSERLLVQCIYGFSPCMGSVAGRLIPAVCQHFKRLQISDQAIQCRLFAVKR